MEVISSTYPIVALLGLGAAFIGYQQGLCKSNKKGSKKSSSVSSTTSDDDWSKPKKQKKNKTKSDKPAAPVDQSIYKPIADDDEDIEEVKPVKAAPKPAAPKPAAVKPAAQKKPEAVKKPVAVVDEKQAEIDRLKQILADMEKKPAAKKAAKAEKPIANDDVYNPAPVMTKDALAAQVAEAERLAAENDASWHEVKSKPRPKKTKKTEEEAKAAPKVDAVAKTFLEAHVPTEKRGFVMGKGAETLKRIVELTNAKIDVPKSDSKSTKVLIEGTAEEAHAAKQAIDDLVNKGFSALLNPELTQALVKVDADKRALVLGTKGANIQKIQEATGVKINFPDRNSSSDSVQIVGDAHGVSIAKGAIRTLLKEGFCHITHEGWTKITVPFPAAYRKNLIGQKGSVIKAIQNNTGCKLNFPEGDADEVVIVGPTAKVYAAATQVAHIQEKLEAPVEDEFAEGFDDEEFEEEQW